MGVDEHIAERERGTLGAIVIDRTGTIIGVSDGVVRHGGIERAALLGRKAIDLVHPDDARRGAEVLEEIQALPGERPEGLYRLQAGDGRYRFYAIRALNLGAEDDNNVVLDFREPTAQLRAQAFADDAVELMGMLSEDISLDESLDWVARVAERHVEGLQIVITVLGIDRPNRVFSRSRIPDDIVEVNRAAAPTALPVHVEAALEELANRRWRASRKIASLDYIVPGRLTSVLVDRSGSIVGYVEALRSTTEAPDESEWLVHGMISRMMTAALRRFEFDRRLRHAADVDSLTGLVNRRKLFELLAADDHLSGSLLYLIDLDRFSWVNNNLGHKAGDDTLIGVAQALTQTCPPEALIARLGGDEFVVWIPADQASHDLEHLGDLISKSMVVPAGIGDKRVWVRASIGMVRIAPGEAAADALNRADIAMYASKRSGGDAATVG